ncbi:MAG: hypothetical protein J7J88_03390 [Dehalococcoidia bacterium]|nr:hypothetical protein [Dehalococcoidia bacterium]
MKYSVVNLNFGRAVTGLGRRPFFLWFTPVLALLLVVALLWFPLQPACG